MKLAGKGKGKDNETRSAFLIHRDDVLTDDAIRNKVVINKKIIIHGIICSHHPWIARPVGPISSSVDINRLSNLLFMKGQADVYS